MSCSARDLEIASPLAAGVASAEAQIVTLTERQFTILDMLNAQRRAVILGVAGSGKTLLAAEKARRLAAQGFEVLLTCFNRPLAEYLAATIGRLDRVTVSTFHRLAEKFGQEAGLIGPDPAHDTPYFDGLPDVLDRALRTVPEPRFDAIVVDEGQDLDQEWWLPLLDLLRDPASGDRLRLRRRQPGSLPRPRARRARRRDAGVAAGLLPQREPAHARRPSTTSPCASPRTDAQAPAPIAIGPDGRPVEIFTYADGDADACRKVLGTVLRRIIDAGKRGSPPTWSS